MLLFSSDIMLVFIYIIRFQIQDLENVIYMDRTLNKLKSTYFKKPFWLEKKKAGSVFRARTLHKIKWAASLNHLFPGRTALLTQKLAKRIPKLTLDTLPGMDEEKWGLYSESQVTPFPAAIIFITIFSSYYKFFMINRSYYW